ncbi:hypothetical protein U9M48_033900 [Paspalum notatum var. saurae]|uniref:Uncharacterized protein n=1 Tax=Paspalum notatum var. saurae TaxID=547442 RepID=A0AAQ3U894_PASNO
MGGPHVCQISDWELEPEGLCLKTGFLGCVRFHFVGPPVYRFHYNLQAPFQSRAPHNAPSYTPRKLRCLLLAALATGGSHHPGHQRSGDISSSSGSCSEGTSISPLLKHCSHTPTTPTPSPASCPASSPRLTPTTRPRTQVAHQMEPVNVGPSEDGHERGRAEVLTHYLDSDDSNDSEADLQMHPSNLPPPQPACSTSRTSTSCGKRHASNPMGSRASFLEGFKTFYHDFSNWKKQKQTSSASKMAEEDAEYEAFMKELLDAGVNPNEYFMASEVLVDVTRRGAYRPLPTIEAKLTWIKRAYLMKIGQPPM